jgi:hypothetical protein
MAAAVGRELYRKTSYPIRDSDIRRWALAVYYPEPPPPLFLDAAFAATTRHKGIVAPEEFNPFAWAAVENTRLAIMTDRVEAQLGIAGPGLIHGLNGGESVEYGVRMRPGDVIVARARLHSYDERSGRLGPMLFTVSEETWTNQEGGLVKTIRQTLIRY